MIMIGIGVSIIIVLPTYNLPSIAHKQLLQTSITLEGILLFAFQFCVSVGVGACARIYTQVYM